MEESTEEKPMLTCSCGYSWRQLGDGPPKRCPRCRKDLDDMGAFGCLIMLGIVLIAIIAGVGLGLYSICKYTWLAVYWCANRVYKLLSRSNPKT